MNKINIIIYVLWNFLYITSLFAQRKSLIDVVLSAVCVYTLNSINFRLSHLISEHTAIKIICHEKTGDYHSLESGQVSEQPPMAHHVWGASQPSGGSPSMVRLPSPQIPERKVAIGLLMCYSMKPRSGVTSLEEHSCIMHALGGSCSTLIWLLQTSPGPQHSLSASWGISEASLGQVKYIIPSAGSCSPVSSKENQEAARSPWPDHRPSMTQFHKIIFTEMQLLYCR